MNTSASRFSGKYQPGDKVEIVNQTAGGRFIHEGTAKVIRRLPYMDDQYVVKFSDGSIVERFIDPNAQTDVAAFVESLNKASVKT